MSLELKFQKSLVGAVTQQCRVSIPHALVMECVDNGTLYVDLLVEKLTENAANTNIDISNAEYSFDDAKTHDLLSNEQRQQIKAYLQKYVV